MTWLINEYYAYKDNAIQTQTILMGVTQLIRF
jgi:hypothetical protein